MIRTALALLISLLLSHVAMRPALAMDPTERDVTYAQVDGHTLRLDFYRPNNTQQPCPLVVWVHGGAWRAGSKADVPVTRWLDSGFAIASVDYRLSPVARFPAQVHDIKAAIRYLRAQAGHYKIDPDRFIIAGGSAGGHLAALVGVSADVESLEGDVGDYDDVSSDVQAIVSFYGASNLQTILAQSTPHGLSVRVPALKLLLGDLPEDAPDLARLASPVTHVDTRDPPLWLIHGDQDPQMPINQAHELDGAYQRAKCSVDFQVIHGGKHGGPEFYTNERLDGLAKSIREAWTQPSDS